MDRAEYITGVKDGVIQAFLQNLYLAGLRQRRGSAIAKEKALTMRDNGELQQTTMDAVYGTFCSR